MIGAPRADANRKGRAAPSTLIALLTDTQARLAMAGIDTPALDARLIVEHFSRTTRADAIARPEMVVDPDSAHAIRDALDRRLSGEPVHRILGFREFYGLKLALSAETLEPRPDTETLIDAVLPFARQTVQREGTCRILDLGTGTGAIALALLSQVEEATATGTDIAEGALDVARKNAESLGLASRFSAVRSDWLAKISGRYHLIVSNPPYIRTDELPALQGEVRNFDPARALDGGAEGVDAYRAVARSAAKHLLPGGRIAVEIGYAQKDQVQGLFAMAGYVLVEARRDLGGRDRVLTFNRDPGFAAQKALGIPGDCG